MHGNYVELLQMSISGEKTATDLYGWSWIKNHKKSVDIRVNPWLALS
jgi:hypothetical protein